MISLVDKQKYYDVRTIEDYGNVYAIPTEDVKEAVLKFQKDILERKVFDYDFMIKKYKEIFGDFEK